MHLIATLIKICKKSKDIQQAIFFTMSIAFLIGFCTDAVYEVLKMLNVKKKDIKQNTSMKLLSIKISNCDVI